MGPHPGNSPAATASVILAASSTDQTSAVGRDVTATEPRITPELVADHGLKPDEYQRILDLIGREPTHHRARHLLGDVERALLLQELEEVAAHPADHRRGGDPGAGRECRRHRHRRRAGGDLQDGEPQPPLLHRAVPRRGDRRRRHPARRLHHGCAADRGVERAPLRRSGPSTHAASGGRRGRRHWRLRQFLRRADRRRRGEFPPPLQRQLPGQRLRARHREQGRRLLFEGGGRRPSRRLSRREDRAATASAARPWPRPSSITASRRSGRPCRSATPSPRSSCWRPASS